ncbi:MAG: hypothetical protein FI682_03635 [SAR202 cluster bacterium]|nr:hypothetical protein [SAR202 cluster bacterium]RZP18577.1 MAG: hypothetical protein EVA33_00190 [Chloroflexota bacterium]|tara:strand:- start:861 stop:1502 length:642 start_codon:yes stop_codon:yes gene_type:complete
MIVVIFIPIFLYLIGSLPTSYLFGKYFLEKNILLEGTKHSGLSNIYSHITFDKVIYILFLDVIIKGALPSFLLLLYFDDYLYFLFFLIIGHNWSIFLNFKGGKGLAISIGIIIGLSLKLFLLLLFLFVIFWAFQKFKDSSLPWLLSFLFTPIVFYYDSNYLNLFFDLYYFNKLYILILLLSLLIFTRTLGDRNYSRINFKTLIFRIIFDRDKR